MTDGSSASGALLGIVEAFNQRPEAAAVLIRLAGKVGS